MKKNRTRLPYHADRISLIGLSVLVLGLGGCGMQGIGDDSAPTSGSMSGPVHRGDQPVSGGGGSADVGIDMGVIGTVRDGAGRPVSGVLVQAIAEPGSPPAPELAVMTNNAGRFVWPLPPGNYRLSARGASSQAVVTRGKISTLELIVR